jgi:hypothetical protein
MARELSWRALTASMQAQAEAEEQPRRDPGDPMTVPGRAKNQVCLTSARVPTDEVLVLFK